MRMSRKNDIVLFVIMVSFWALNYPLVKFALNYVDSFTLLFYRILISLVGILIIFNRKLRFNIRRNEIIPLFILSMLNVFIFMELWFIAETTISSSLSAILIYTYPVISTLLSIIFLKESYNRYVILGIILGFSGVIVIFFHGLISGLGIGVLIAFLGSVSWASGTIYYKKYLGGTERETTNFYQFAFAIVPALMVAGVFQPNITLFEPNLTFLIIVIIIGFPGTAIAYYAFLHLNREYRVSTISSFLFLVPALSVIFSIFLLNEIPSVYEIAGLLLVSIGIIFSAKGINK